MSNCTELIERADSIKNKLAGIQATLEANRKIKQEYEDSLRENGYDPNNLDAEIAELKKERDEMQAKIDADLTELGDFVRDGMEALKT
jgi:chromosome segregation ATPase